MGWKRTDNAILREIAGEALLVPLKGKLADMQKVYVLGGVGSFVWGLLDGSRELADLVSEVTREFEVGPDEAKCDVGEFIEGLRAAGLASDGMAS